MASAQKFALGAMDIISNLHADTLMFGSECGDLARIMQTVYCIRSGEFSSRLRQLLDSGMNLAKARETAVHELCGNGELLRNPNDTLAIEYISAAKTLNSKINFVAVKRNSVGHNDTDTVGNFCSASVLREMIKRGDIEKAAAFMPEESFSILKREAENGKISDLLRLELAILAVLRTTSIEVLKKVPDTSEGIEYRILNAARMAKNWNSLLEYAATKRYTNARLRRLILSAFLREKAEEIPQNVPFIRILGTSDIGNEILKNARESSKLPIIMRSSELKENPVFDFEAKATDVYSLSQITPENSGIEFTNGIITNR